MASSLALSSCLRLPSTPEAYKVYWMHLEGAPFRALFDFWPSLTQKVELPGLKHVDVKVGERDLVLPSVWRDHPAGLDLLQNWLSVRGLTTASPHLAQCRREWFGATNSENSIVGEPTTKESLALLFKSWKKSSLVDSKDQKIQPSIINGHLHNGTFKRFENINEINDESVALYHHFYSELILELTQFVSLLKKQQVFDKSVIIITNDRGRAPASSTFPSIIEPVWQGSQLSLISGSLHGPINLGHIYHHHPKYSQAYPGTWGTPKSNWGPRDVYDLIDDLLKPKVRQKEFNLEKGNPWITPRPLQGFFVKLPPGKIV